MNPIHPWLDPEEVRRLAEKLLAPVNHALAPRAGDPGFDSAFVGFATAPAPVPSSVPATPEDHPPAEPAATTPAPTNTVAVASRPLLERIQRFREWLGQHFSATGDFILDRDGTVIFDESGHGKLHFLARSLALAARRPGCPAGNVQVKVGTTATLEVIPVETPFGWLILGAVVPEALPPAAIVAITDALTQVAAPPRRSPG